MFSRPQVIENSRQYLLLRTEILQKINSRWVPLKDDLGNVSSLFSQTIPVQFAHPRTIIVRDMLEKN